MSANGHAWWEDAVVYQVYPRSFADADGNGVGDLPGLRSRLPYLADLGVDAIWLTPFYPSPLADGGYDVSDYRAVDPLLGTMADFDALVKDAEAHQIRVIVDLVPNHCSSAHPLFQAALAAPPGSPERDRFIFRDGRGADGELPPNNWKSMFGGGAWTRVTEADGRPGQWYLHLFDTGQPDWNWRNDEVHTLFEQVIRFWLDRGVAGLRVDVAHGIYKDPALPDEPDPDHVVEPINAPSAYHHRPELQALYRSWRAILDSYPAQGFPGTRTAIGEVWYDVPGTLLPYLAHDGLPQVFNFQLILASWGLAGFRDGDRGGAGAGRRLARAVGHRQPRRTPAGEPLSAGRGLRAADDQQADRPRSPARRDRRPPRPGRRPAAARPARIGLHLPGRGARPARGHRPARGGAPGPEVPPDRRRSHPGATAAACRCRGPGTARTSASPAPASPAAPWLPQPPEWGGYSAEAQLGDPDSFLSLYRAALRLRREHPALGRGTLRWLDAGRATRRACSPSPGTRASSSPRTWAAPRSLSRRTGRSCWPASRIRWPRTGACRPTPRSGCQPEARTASCRARSSQRRQLDPPQWL